MTRFGSNLILYSDKPHKAEYRIKTLAKTVFCSIVSDAEPNTANYKKHLGTRAEKVHYRSTEAKRTSCRVENTIGGR